MAKIIEPPPKTERKTPPTRQVKRSVRRLESRSKVTGSAEYIHNLTLPGMLYGKIARSSVSHGKILSIDPSAAPGSMLRILPCGIELRAIFP